MEHAAAQRDGRAPHPTVRAVRGIPIYDDGIDRGDLLTVHVTNTGQRSVSVNSIELELPDGSHYPKIASVGKKRPVTS